MKCSICNNPITTIPTKHKDGTSAHLSCAIYGPLSELPAVKQSVASIGLPILRLQTHIEDWD